MTSDSNEALFKRIYEDEEHTNIVLSIREELMDRVMDECYKRYLKRQTLKFIVQCAYDALVKFLSFNLYYHPDLISDVTQPLWTPDSPIEPSPKDTWACDAVSIRPAVSKVDPEIKISYDSVMETRFKFDPKENENLKICSCMEHVCTCLGVPENYLSDRFHRGRFYSKFSKSIKGSFAKRFTHRDSDTRWWRGSELYKKTSDTISERSMATSSTNTEGFGSKAKKAIFKHNTIKKHDKGSQIFSEVALDIPGIPSQGSMLELPPIRVNSVFKARPVEKVKEKKKGQLFLI